MATTVRIDEETHALLKEIAKGENISMHLLLRRALETYRREGILREANRAYGLLREDSRAWDELLQEREKLDGLLDEGISEGEES
ncbi:MAG TPA: ribbon-helix-helix protein, CopG family [Thermoanaerobaculia bacterium]|nr:ribbon-helix-helix protein, CopG family [Thermoanaerobaculia bacterium]HUM30934.1 ribbon-helix-helix protein, CopG family [Thermoanaerobaculia bacterium]HXK69267.1 ribbon-helix-helix protein, CopG family [Thermoanaerobaculia bacterium]